MKDKKFTLIQGFDSLEDAKECVKHLFGNHISPEEFSYKCVKGMYYAVTLDSYYTEIAVSKEYVKYRIYKQQKNGNLKFSKKFSGCEKTSEVAPFDLIWNGTDGGKRGWDNTVCKDFALFAGEPIQTVIDGKCTSNKWNWKNNTNVFLGCLFANETRFDDDTYYHHY